MRTALALAVLLLTPVAVEAAPEPLRVVPQLDLERYAGTWYEIARLPNRFQRKCAGDVKATYTLRPDGRIAVVNQCRTAEGTLEDAAGVARRVAGRPGSVLQVRFAPAFLSFLPAVWGDYWVVALDGDYQHAVVGSPNRDYLWVLARTPQIDRRRYEQLLDDARRQGFDVSKVVETRQRPAGSAAP
jgi:apolipoprotein D and lipocalin family protein